MKKISCLICIAIILGGCALNQRPSWIVTGNRQLDKYKKSCLTQGYTEITEKYFQEAVEEIKKSGNLNLLEKAWLTRMALQVAVLKEMDGEDYVKIAAVNPVPANENYYMLLNGNISEVKSKLIPRQYRKFLNALAKDDIPKTELAIARMKGEPVSQLIAAGIAVSRDMESEAIINTAIEAASENGWKMALIVWMERLSAFHEATGDAAKAAEVQRRIELIKK